MKKWELRKGTKVVIAGIMITLATSTINTGYKLVKDKFFKAKKTEQAQDQTIDLTDDVKALEALKDTFVEYYEENNPKYNFTFEELLAFEVLTNNRNAEQLEDIYDGEIPTYDEMHRIIMSFYMRASSNYTYASSKSGLSKFITNEDERRLFETLENAMLIVNQDEMNGNLNQTNINNAKNVINEILNGSYSNGLKSFVASTVSPALDHLTGVPGFKMTNEERKDYEKAIDTYTCDLIVSYKLERDEALKINGKEREQISIEQAIDEYFDGKTTFIEYLRSELRYIPSYNRPIDEEFVYRNRTVVKEAKKEEKKESSNTKNNTTKSNHNNKQTSPKDKGTKTNYKDMTKEEKKQADKITNEKDANLEKQNKFNERLAKDAKVAIQSYLDAVSAFVEKEVVKLCNNSSVGPAHVEEALNKYKRSMITDYIDMDVIKVKMIEEELNKWLKSFKKNYTDLYPTTSEKHEQRKTLYKQKMSIYLKETDENYTKIEYNGKKITPLTFAIMNGAQNGYTSYLTKNASTIIEDNITNPATTITVPSDKVEEAIENVPQGQNTTIIVDEYDDGFYDSPSEWTKEESIITYEEVGVNNNNNNNNNSSNNTTNYQNTQNQGIQYNNEFVPPVLDLTGTQTETVEVYKYK